MSAISPLRIELSHYLATLLPKIGLVFDQLGPDGDLTVRAAYHGVELDIIVMALEVEQVISLSAEIGTVESSRQEEMMAAISSANFLGAVSSGLSFACSPRSGSIHLGYSLLYPGGAYVLFETAFTRILALGSDWKSQLSKGSR